MEHMLRPSAWNLHCFGVCKYLGRWAKWLVRNAGGKAFVCGTPVISDGMSQGSHAMKYSLISRFIRLLLFFIKWLCDMAVSVVSRVVWCLLVFCFFSGITSPTASRWVAPKYHLRTHTSTQTVTTRSPLQIMHEGYIADAMLTIGGCDKTVSANLCRISLCLEKPQPSPITFTLHPSQPSQHAHARTRTHAPKINACTRGNARPGAGSSDAHPSTQQRRTHALRRHGAPRALRGGVRGEVG